MASKNVCTSAALVSPDPLSPAPHNFSATKTPEKTEEDPDDSEPAAKWDIQMESIEAVTKNYLYKIRWVQVPSDTLNIQ